MIRPITAHLVPNPTGQCKTLLAQMGRPGSLRMGPTTVITSQNRQAPSTSTPFKFEHVYIILSFGLLVNRPYSA